MAKNPAVRAVAAVAGIVGIYGGISAFTNNMESVERLRGREPNTVQGLAHLVGDQPEVIGIVTHSTPERGYSDELMKAELAAILAVVAIAGFAYGVRP